MTQTDLNTNANTRPTLRNHVIVVTGAGRGLGAAISRVLSADGATVVATDLDAANAERTATELIAEGGQSHAIALDVGDEAAVRGALDDVVDRFGRIDAVINNAAIDITLPIDELNVEDWDRVVRTNLRGPFLLAKHASALMRKRAGGAIVNIASTASRRAWPNASVYHATKWGLLGLSHALHAELRPHGIKVSAVIAGGMRTPFLLDRFPDIDVNNLQDPANVAAAVRFVLLQPAETVIPEVMVLPMRETSWP
ncbi:SDR family oxidoreductase [Ralstonia mannitolilytica]|uniref:SDR family oxidoreductase n=1 Tax=Ralstonia mannitolilytica TaxID=105219 RepID=UPI0005EAEF39|nr:SDR family oxidoreductase [Ralstonia mannitolilytica]QIF10109.1 SDR family oxidoreductase [Ralstonia mannitolilytica]CAJ0731058.1 Dihydroanticapsin 7-dehydrogenase [Ralstonia mannitolilytica]CAJ0787190.1 Dihydroanticapsin 7-dehydrogenase [Ralstonia mannitolilytica]